MKARQIGTVTLPARPTSGMALLPWCNGVNNALQQLRDRGIDVKGQGGRIYANQFPFQLSITVNSLIGQAGTINGDAINTFTEASPIDGTWYMEAYVEIDGTTGDVVTTDVYFTQTEGTPSATDYYYRVASIDVTDGIPDITTINQYNYGPLLLMIVGGISDKWQVNIY